MNKERIELTDVILVVNVGGYIGNSISKEIEFAKLLDKEIMCYIDFKK